MFRALFAFSFSLFATLPAAAASSAWTQSEGGAVRVVTSGLSDENGHLRGALEIRLKPGWKTYWRDPGESGIPPRIDISGSPQIEGAELLFPAPERITDPYSTWAGYKHSVTLPIVFQLPDAGMAGVIEGTASVGICESICIPVEAPFSFDAGVDPDNPQDRSSIEAAFASLPEKASEGFRVHEVSRDSGKLLFRAELPANSHAPGLFIAAPEGIELLPPEITSRENGWATFAVEIIDDSTEQGVELDYTLVAGERAVAGTLNLPQE